VLTLITVVMSEGNNDDMLCTYDM